MTIFSQDDPDAAWDDKPASIALQLREQRDGGQFRGNRRRDPNTVSRKQYLCMIALGETARAWREELTAAQRLQWGAKDDSLDVRDGTTPKKHAVTRFVQVNMPLNYIGFDPVMTGVTKKAYLVTGLTFLRADSMTQKLYVYYLLSKQDATAHRSVMHVSQVPEEYVGAYHLWQYARWIGSNELSCTEITPSFSSESNDYDPLYPFAAGDKLQLYIRICHVQNVNPPVSKHESRETTEDWTTLTATAV